MLISMDERRTGASPSSPQGADDAPGIPWEAGEEDYPFAALPGEAALEYFQRWLDHAGYARVERDGARYVHETDVANVVNHITADVGLLRARLDQFGDRVVTSADHAATVEGIEGAIAQLGDALAMMRNGDQTKR
jgi:hypothetical protein